MGTLTQFIGKKAVITPQSHVLIRICHLALKAERGFDRDAEKNKQAWPTSIRLKTLNHELDWAGPAQLYVHALTESTFFLGLFII